MRAAGAILVVFGAAGLGAFFAGHFLGRLRELEELRASLECIRAAAAELIDGIESRCPELFPKQPQRESKNRKPSLER